jgi:hypothetical protein
VRRQSAFSAGRCHRAGCLLLPLPLLLPLLLLLLLLLLWLLLLRA